MTKISIKNLKVRTIIGVGGRERHNMQDIIINIDLAYDAGRAIETDNINYAVDYEDLTNKISRYVEDSYFFLLEKLADEILNIIMGYPEIRQASVRIDKPEALQDAESVSVELSRKRHE